MPMTSTPERKAVSCSFFRSEAESSQGLGSEHKGSDLDAGVAGFGHEFALLFPTPLHKKFVTDGIFHELVPGKRALTVGKCAEQVRRMPNITLEAGYDEFA